MSRFSNPRTAQAMMETHGHTNIGMPPKPGFPGAAAPVRPGVKPTITGAPATPMTPKPAPMPMAGTRPGVTTGGPKPAPAPAPVQAPASINGLGSRFARAAKPMKKGGKVSSASKRADGCAVKGKTRGRMI